MRIQFINTNTIISDKQFYYFLLELQQNYSFLNLFEILSFLNNPVSTRIEYIFMLQSCSSAYLMVVFQSSQRKNNLIVVQFYSAL